MRCDELVDLVTDYLDGALPEPVRIEFEEHLPECPGCTAAIAQWRTVIDLAGQLTEEDIKDVDPLARDRIMHTFQRLRRR
jgi:anti-sigma factor RsiW